MWRRFVRLMQERKGKEDLKNRQFSGFSLWEAMKKKETKTRCNRGLDKRSRVQLWLVVEEEIPGNS